MTQKLATTINRPQVIAPTILSLSLSLSNRAMGIIKDAKISGTVPSTEAFAVQYPGYPSSMSRAIQTLGGTDAIVKARSLQSNKLELRFRPEDPYSHPAFGELHPCNNLLLKISKKKSCDGQSAEASNRVLECSSPSATNSGNESESVAAAKQVEVQKPEDRINLCADIVARVSESYHFDGMADYQHVVAVHADVARRKKRNWTEVEEPHFEKCGLLDMDQEDVMILLPPLFAPKDMPENLVLRPPAPSSSKKKQERAVQNLSEIDIEAGLAIDFSIKEIPKKVNWKEFIAPSSDQWEGQMAVSKLFDERPIWHKESLIEHLLDKGLKFSHQILKRLLLGVAYYFSNGPFLRFWIRKGYDPRTDPESRIYQRIDFRVHPQLQTYRDAKTSDLKHRWEDLYAFRVFPYKFHTSFQLFEFSDDYIQQEIRKPTKKTTCDCKTGWFSACVLDSIRHRVTMRFLSVYPGPGAEKYLKTASDDFEKSKRMCIKDALKVDQEEHQQVNREHMGDVDKEKPENVVDDEEDEIAVDDGEEESDMYEALDLGGEEDNISLQSQSYLDLDNNSRTYLQELFGAFPSNEAGGDKIQDADTSDEEYQIYERDSDGNYSDDDD